MKLKPTIKKAWLEALRSGDYQQTTGALNDGKGMCCLGVLCDVMAKRGHGEWAQVSTAQKTFVIGQEVNGAVLPYGVIKLAFRKPNSSEHSSDWCDPMVQADPANPESAVDITELNDAKRLTFPQIADAIERSL